MGGFYLKTRIPKDIEVSEITDEFLEEIHDEVHILWKKLEEGYRLNWKFSELFDLHMRVVLEMGKREMMHIAPINDLDRIFFN